VIFLIGKNDTLIGFFEQRCLNDFSKTGLRSIFVVHGENDHGTEENLIVKYTQDYIQRSRDLMGAPQLAFIISKSNFGGSDVNIAKIRSAQKRMLTEIKYTMEGPDLESINGIKYRWDGVHFNSAGMEEAAIRWDNALPISYFSTSSQYIPK